MMASVAKALPTGAEWSYEVKWDGYRAQAVKNGPTVSLASRNLKNITKQFPAVARAVAAAGAKAAVIDGEIVALDADGRPSFQALHHSSTAGLSVVYYAFDLLHLNGRDLLHVPLDDRRDALRDVVGDSGVLLSDPLPGSASQIEAAVRRLRLEGVVAKRRDPSTSRDDEATRGSRCDSRGIRSSSSAGSSQGPGPSTRCWSATTKDGSCCSPARFETGSLLISAPNCSRGSAPLHATRCPFANLPSTQNGPLG